MNWLDAVERTVTALGYDLVDTERAAGGLLRVYIDRVPGRVYETGVGKFITVDDCEKVTRQLQQVLEVEGATYERLEVSSPGLDRPLKRESDFERFTGENVALTLKLPFKGRKKFQGELRRTEAGWRLVLEQPEKQRVKRTKKSGRGVGSGAGSAAGARVGAGAGAAAGAASAAIPAVGEPESRLKPLLRGDRGGGMAGDGAAGQGPAGEGSEAPQLALDFSLDEVREARLVPELDFKGRRFTEQAARQTATADTPLAGDHVDGGRDK